MARRVSQSPEDEMYEFLAGTFGLKAGELRRIVQAPESPQGPVLEMAAVLALQNQPEFWAGAPWRLEPDRESLPVSFILRDANLIPPGKGPWRLDLIKLEQRLADGSWHKVADFTPSGLPGLDEQGYCSTDYWSYGDAIPLSAMKEVQRGSTVSLRAVFLGSFKPHAKQAPVEIYLETFLAERGLPQGRAECAPGARRWFYGDTHYHSAYSSDVKEFGAAVADAQQAAQAVGLDWLVVTDHSCDLDEVDPGHGGLTRWQRLRADLADDNPQFRTILGEEITLAAGGKRLVHMLACGGMEEMIPGAFLPSESDDIRVNLIRRAVEKIVRAGAGYPADIPQRLFGEILTLDEVMKRLPVGTLTFAAHPYDVAQVPPATWEMEDLSHPRLTGFEFWNGRQRRSVTLTTNPFARKEWTNAEKAQQRDRQRIAKLQKQAKENWDPHLQRGVAEWSEAEALPARRPVFVAGGDAHGDFNYHIGLAWDYQSFNVDDNALGRVRTAVEIPVPAGAGVPAVGAILAALRKGACVVTDGPILEMAVRHGAREARMGEVLVVDGKGAFTLEVIGHSAPEFGPVTEAEVVTYFHGPHGGIQQSTRVQAGEDATIQLDGLQGYLRVQASTMGRTGEQFCCFTNPVWVRLPEGGGTMVIQLRQGG